MLRRALAIAMALTVGCSESTADSQGSPDRSTRADAPDTADPTGQDDPGQAAAAETGLSTGPVPEEVPAPAPQDGGAVATTGSEQGPPRDPKADEADIGKEYPLYGVTFHFLAHVFAKPDRESQVVGYMRRGAQFRAKEGVDGPGCQQQWHEVPGKGYVCRGEGYILDDRPRSFEPAPQPPALEQALPYRYAWVVRDDVLQYWRVPTPEEQTRAEQALEKWSALQRTADGGAGTAGVDAGRAVPSDAGAQRDAAADGGLLPDYVRMPMQRGFYVSLDREVEDGDRTFQRTVRGGVIPKGPLARVEPPTPPGTVLGGDLTLPLAIVLRDGVQRLQRDPLEDKLIRDGHVDRYTRFTTAGSFVRRGRRYAVARDGFLVRESAVRTIRPVHRPEDIPEGARWIHVDLAEQALTAYAGERPVYATLVSSGREEFETPTGVFRITAKHITTTMDDLESDQEAYLIEDVPWTMYFKDNYALHGTFWHKRFGHVRSHGCVNLAPADARWLFSWTTPVVPTAWHGTVARQDTGTWVYVTG